MSRSESAGELNLSLWRCCAASSAALAGLTAAVFGDSYVALFAVIAVASVLGVAGMLICTAKAGGCNLWEIYAFVLCIGYGLGTLQTFAGGYFLDFDPLLRAGMTVSSLSKAISLVLLLVCALLILSLLDRRRFAGDSRVLPSQHSFVLFLFFVVTSAAVAMVAAGRIRFGGDVAADADIGIRLSATASLVSESLTPVGAIALYCARTANARMRAAVLLLAAIDLLIFFTQGRRLLAFAIVAYTMGYAAGGPPLRLLSVRSLAVALLLLLVVIVGSRFLFAMRIAQYDDATKKDVVSLVARGGKIFLDPKDDRLDQKLKENLAERAFILAYLAELLQRLDQAQPLKGEVLFNAFITAVPELFFPWKYKYMYGMEEDLVHPRLGLPVWDAPNTTLTAGASDFGIIGVFLYPILALAACQVVLRIALYWGALVHGVVYFALANMLLNVENQFVGITAGLRDATLIGILVFLGFWLFERFRATGLASVRLADHLPRSISRPG